MLSRIARFELSYQLRSPLFFIAFALFFLFAFGSVTSENIQIGAGGNVHVNAPYAILQTVGVLNVFALFVVTAFVANVVIRDDETGFAPLVRSTRVTKFAYLVGRFAGAVLVALGVMLSVPLAMLVGSFMPWIDPEKLGPTFVGHYLFAYVVFGLPTLLALGAGFFALATATRSMMWTFIGVVVFLILFVVSRVMLRDPAWDTVSAWTDPFGMSALNQATKYWTPAERNTRLPPLEGLLLYNRLLWLAVGMALFALAYGVFRFEVSGSSVMAGKASAGQGGVAEAVPAPHPLARPRSGGGAFAVQFLALVRFDMRFVLRSPAFIVLLFLGLFNAVGALSGIVSDRGVDYLPVTRAVINAMEGGFNLFPILIAIFYGGELVWRDRERRMHEIVDASAAPDWAFMLPKALAVSGVLLATYGAAVLGAMAFQAFHGYMRFELGLYLLGFLLPGFFTAALLGVLSVFVQALVPHKFVGWAVMLVWLVASFVLGSLGFELNVYNYGAVPAVPLSDMNGLGHFWLGRAWTQAYWAACAAVLLVLAHLLWRRGGDTRLRPRLARLPLRLRGGAGVLLGTAALAWVGLGGWVLYNTTVLNRHLNSDEVEALSADAEKTLLSFERLPQPTIGHVELEVSLYPQALRADTRGHYLLENRSGQPLQAVHVRWNADLLKADIRLQGAALDQEWPKFGYRIYRLDQPMQPGEKRRLDFTTVFGQRGFVNGRPQTGVVANGSFLNNFDIAPLIGMGREGLLQDRAKRRKHGLPPELRPAKLEDEGARRHHYLRHDSDWVTAQITLSTDADQTPVAPGTTVSDSTAGGRRTVVTRTEAPIQNFFSLQSARYEVRRDTWKNAQGQAVELAVYHHGPHDTNVQRMLDAMKVSLAVFSERFSPYQFRQARILEFPAYASFAQSFANTVPYSEAIGFVQNFKDEDADEKIDLVTYVTAHEIAHQWWAHQVIGADKQGMTLLSESFAQYGALLVMEKLYGKAQLRKFLKYELDAYLRSRGREILEELPLNRVENQGYIHYNKGALAMWALKEHVGEAVVNRALQRLITEFAFKPAPYPSSADFLRLLREQAGPAHEGFISDLFEKITLYDLKAVQARSVKRADGRFDVSFTVEAKKFHADGKGVETEAPLSESFEIGAFTAEPGKKGYRADAVIALERRTLVSGRQDIRLVLDKEPSFMGVDPFNGRIDRNSNDNLVKVGAGAP